MSKRSETQEEEAELDTGGTNANQKRAGKGQRQEVKSRHMRNFLVGDRCSVNIP